MHPTIRYTYQIKNQIDSTRWEHYTPRKGDVIISTSYKSGTAWMQLIVCLLIKKDCEGLGKLSPWLEEVSQPIENVMSRLDAQTSRRVIKTHLPLDALPYFPEVYYIVVCRDPRDVFMSLWNHYQNYTETYYQQVNQNLGPNDPIFPKCPENIHDFWQTWITKAWFPWENEGYPFWGNLRHTQTWWDYRHLPNIQLIHFNQLLQEPAHEISKVADFIQVPCSPTDIAQIVKQTAFDQVRANSDSFFTGGTKNFKKGSKSLFHKGTNGRWRTVLSLEELEQYQHYMQKNLSPDIVRWLETGDLK